MVVFSYYPADTRPRREAEALIKEGISVDMICLRKDFELKKEIVNNVRVYRLPLKRRRGGKLRYLWEYGCFIMMSFFALSFLFMREQYKVIHVHNMPDILVFSSLIPRLCGSKIILDLHDPVPELFMAKYNIKNKNWFICILRLQEKYSIRFADIVLTPNIAFRNLFVSRGCPKSKIHIVMNSAQESIFHKYGTDINLNFRNNSKFIIIYHGTITERNGIGVALEAIALLCDKIPNIVFHVYGEGDFVNQFRNLVIKLGLENIVYYDGHVTQEKVALAIQSSHIGLIPNKHSIHWELCVPTRIFEYLSLERPVIVPCTKGIKDYFDNESMCFFESGNVESLARAIFEVYSNPKRVAYILSRGIATNKKYRWELQRQHLLKLVTTLLGLETRQNIKI